MHRSFESKSLVTASLLLSLISPLPLPGTTPGTSSALAQAPTTQDRKAEADRLLDEGLKQHHDLEWSTLTTLVSAYDSLKENQKIIEFAQQGNCFSFSPQILKKSNL